MKYSSWSATSARCWAISKSGSSRPSALSTRSAAALMIVIRVQHQQQVERLGDDRVDLVRLGRHAEHHVQEVGRVAHVVERVDVWLPDALLVRPGGNGRHLGQQPMDAYLDVLRVEWVLAV